jgi:hypothetical protein
MSPVWPARPRGALAVAQNHPSSALASFETARTIRRAIGARASLLRRCIASPPCWRPTWWRANCRTWRSDHFLEATPGGTDSTVTGGDRRRAQGAAAVPGPLVAVSRPTRPLPLARSARRGLHRGARRWHAAAHAAAELVNQLLADIPPTGELDVLRELARPLPVLVIAEMLGLPSEGRRLFKAWSDGIAGGMLLQEGQ